MINAKPCGSTVFVGVWLASDGAFEIAITGEPVSYGAALTA
ncbi:hypothetical protein ACQR3P_03710 [Rhodococcus sp. IEGM1300]